MAKSPAKPRAGRRTAASAETATASPEDIAVPPEAGAETATSEPAEERQDVPGAGSPEDEPAPAAAEGEGAPASDAEPSPDAAPPREDSAEEGVAPQRATSAGMVEAKLKVRWASGGRPHEAGETVPMTRGTYERLKKFGRVE
ncbi:hypothetical protein [Halomonas organivorans]|uniref:Uncharacterized protein n=1 Tax=Halomonas organivorans TaxID=257772 RepID=A0A7W5BZV6_9GAMM|nr:hypothetical protein [Halomonas organivorans]MBB3142197.1 hypothetical protein [Halomonas organivorans]